MVNLKGTKNKEGAFINGKDQMKIYIKVNFKIAKEMEKGYFFGVMAVDIKAILNKEYKMDLELCIEKMEVKNMKGIG